MSNPKSYWSVSSHVNEGLNNPSVHSGVTVGLPKNGAEGSNKPNAI